MPGSLRGVGSIPTSSTIFYAGLAPSAPIPRFRLTAPDRADQFAGLASKGAGLQHVLRLKEVSGMATRFTFKMRRRPLWSAPNSPRMIRSTSDTYNKPSDPSSARAVDGP